MSDWQRRIAKAQEAIAGIDREAAILSRRVQHAWDTYELDPELTEHLSDFEKAVLASNGDLPFGYRVSGSTVHVNTD